MAEQLIINLVRASKDLLIMSRAILSNPPGGVELLKAEQFH